MTEITDNPSFVHLFSSASLRIGEDDWSNLVQSDMKLAAQVGLLLLKNNKELELVLDATQKEYEEQHMRAEQCENKAKNANELLEKQCRTYSTLERQVEDLTTKYILLTEDCRKYRERNKILWQRVESLEHECDDYLQEINSLKEQEITKELTHQTLKIPTNSKSRRNSSLPEDNTNTFSSSYRRQNSTTTATMHYQIRYSSSNESLSDYDITLQENEELKSKIEILEHQLSSIRMSNNERRDDGNSKDTLKSNDYIDGLSSRHDELNSRRDDLKIRHDDLNEVFYSDTQRSERLIQQNPHTYFTRNDQLMDAKYLDKTSLPTVRHYHELFAEIFAKLKETRNDSS